MMHVAVPISFQSSIVRLHNLSLHINKLQSTTPQPQMNGAELPCGTALGVQPADMSYNKRSNSIEKTSTHNNQGTANGLGE